MSKYFGTDGFRGEAGISLTSDHAYKAGLTTYEKHEIEDQVLLYMFRRKMSISLET